MLALRLAHLSFAGTPPAAGTPPVSSGLASDGPMNRKFPYVLANGAKGVHTLAPPHRGRYFEVVSQPINTTYSEIFWTSQGPIPLPDDFVKKFAGKVAAFAGYEVDVVRRNSTGGWQSVPAYEQYNHHFAVQLLGNGSKLVDIGRTGYLEERDIMAHRHAPKKVAMMRPEARGGDQAVPVAQMMVEGNGNEHRRSFKFMPKGFGQLLESPTSFAPNFMMINTNNPETPDWGKRGGPLPKGGEVDGWTSWGAMSPPGANYSGLLECPCTTRVKKVFTGHTPSGTAGQCGDGLVVATADECFGAAAKTFASPDFRILANKTTHDGTDPPGCYVLSAPHGFTAIFNTDASSTAKCGAAPGRLGAPPYVGAAATSAGPASAPASSGSVKDEKAGVTLLLELDTKADEAKLTLSGPVGKWFAVAFGGRSMEDEPYTVEVGVGKGGIVERKIGNHEAGTVLQPSVTLVSDTSSGAVRTVVLSRKLGGLTKQHYTFDVAASAVDTLMASGSDGTFGYHGPARGGDALMLVGTGVPVCLCRSAVMGGSINGLPWTNDCDGPPASDLMQQHNPSCDIRTYRGGMFCCHDGVHLLDADQPLPTRPDVFFLKFRFYYEEEPVAVNAPNATRNAFFLFREVEHNHGEYDVPVCPKGTPPEQCVHTLTGHFTLEQTMQDCKGNRAAWMCAPVIKGSTYPQSQAVDMVHISAHCHAPACLSMELLNADTGETICKVSPIYGTGDEAHDESGYVVGLPPCAWGGADEGLAPPPRIPLGTNLTAIKKVNSSIFHFGVMAHWQMRGAWAPAA